MSDSTYILCPGQGAQTVGMGRDYFDKSQAARDVFASADQTLGFELSKICFEGPEDQLNRTDISQPAIYTTSIASYWAAADAGVVDHEQITGFAGLSLGEYTALYLAAAIGFEDGLRLVAARGKLMQETAEQNRGTMVAVMGGDEEAIADLCRQAADGQVLAPANLNAPGQVVCSGDVEACDRLVPLAEQAGFKAMKLVVAGAFHSPLMQPAAERMIKELQNVEISQPAKPVWANVTAEPHGDVDSIRNLLVRQITEPVRWSQIMQQLVAEEPRFIELAPGRVLAGLLKRVNRRLSVTHLNAATALTPGDS